MRLMAAGRRRSRHCARHRTSGLSRKLCTASCVSGEESGPRCRRGRSADSVVPRMRTSGPPATVEGTEGASRMTKTRRRSSEDPAGGPSRIARLVSSTEHLIQSGECPRCHGRLPHNPIWCPTCKVSMQEVLSMAMQGHLPPPVRKKTPDEERSAKVMPLVLLLGASAAALSAAALVESALLRLQDVSGASSDPNDQFLQGLLVSARNVGLVTCLLFV